MKNVIWNDDRLNALLSLLMLLVVYMYGTVSVINDYIIIYILIIILK